MDEETKKGSGDGSPPGPEGAVGYIAAGWSVVKKHWPGFLLDLAVIYATAAWWTTPFKWMRFFHYPLIAGLLQWEKFYRFLPVRIVYLGFTFLFISVTLFMVAPLQAISVPLTIAVLATVPVAIFIAIKREGSTVRAVAHGFVPAFVAAMIATSVTNQPCSKEECQQASLNPKLETLLDLTSLPFKRGLPRFILRRPDRNDFIVLYRTPSGTSFNLDVSADRVDLGTGEVDPVKAITEEPIGSYYHRPSGRTFIVTANKFNHVHPKTMNVLGPDLRLERVIDFPHGEDDDYTAHIMEYDGKTAIRAEGDGTYLFDPVTLDLDLVAPTNLDRLADCWLAAEPGFQRLDENRFIVAGSIDPLVYFFLPAHSVCTYDLSKMKFIRSYHSPYTGVIDIALMRDRKELLATSMWMDIIWVLDAETLEQKRTLHIGPGVRPVGYNPETGYGYTIESFTGELVVFDVVTGEEKDRTYVGRNARKIYYYDDLGIVMTTGCGVFRLKEKSGIEQDDGPAEPVEAVTDE